MSKQFTVITKDGSKWLRVVCPFKHGEEGWHGFYDVNPDTVYLGDHIEGTTLDESEVRELTQCRVKNAPSDKWQEIGFGKVPPPNFLFEARIAYADAEPPDIDYEKEMPHKEWPSTKHVARPADAESHELSEFDEILNNTSDDAKMNVSLQMEKEYWKQRALAAEKLIDMESSDPKTYDNFCCLREEWEEIVKQEPR